MIPKRFRIPVLSLLCLTAAQAEPERNFSLTISPIHLALPVFEITGEYALAPNFGVAAIAGYGTMDLEHSDGTTEDMGVLELGAQAAYYVFGDFKGGMQVGGELLWIKPFLPDQEDITVSANGVAIGPMLGYKWVTEFGLTIFLQGGYQFLFASAKAKNSAGEEAEASGDTGIPLVNINAGWSF